MQILLFNAHDVVLLFTIYQCIVMAIALFLLSIRQIKSGIFVTLFFLANATTPLDTLISFGDGFHEFAIENMPNWFYVFEMGYWLEGPFLLWYLRSLVYKNYRLRAIDLLYIMPFLLFFLHQLLAYHSMPTITKVYLERHHDLASESVSVFYIVFVRSALRVYFGFLCLQEMQRYFATMHHKFSNFNDAAFRWVQILVYGFFVVWCWGLLIAAALIANNHFGGSVDVRLMGLTSNYSICLLLGAVLISLGTRTGSIEQLEYVQRNEKLNPAQVVDPVDVELLEHALAEKKLFMDPTLNLESLAKQLHMSPRNLSVLINRHYQRNFYEVINKYRIEEAKRLMLDEKRKNATILDIMYEVGFNSKTTFNSCFKKQVSVTPRDFKKQQEGLVQTDIDV